LNNGHRKDEVKGGTMPETQTKYDELKDALMSSWDEYNRYELDCRQFFKRFRDKLADYLQCSVGQIRWLPFPESENEEQLRARGVVDLTVDRMMALYEDAFYEALFTILFDTGGINLRVKVKKAGECFSVDLEDWKQRVYEDRQENWNELSEYIFTELKNHFETRFKDFVRGQRSSIGFATPQSRRESRAMDTEEIEPALS
jgi:hypothetical protein